MKLKLFRYGYLIRHAFDLGRIFPIIIKQRGIAKLMTGISSHFVEALSSIWSNIINPHQEFAVHFVSIPSWIDKLPLLN